jgi:hypothetical protein
MCYIGNFTEGVIDGHGVHSWDDGSSFEGVDLDLPWHADIACRQPALSCVLILQLHKMPSHRDHVLMQESIPWGMW